MFPLRAPEAGIDGQAGGETLYAKSIRNSASVGKTYSSGGSRIKDSEEAIMELRTVLPANEKKQGGGGKIIPEYLHSDRCRPLSLSHKIHSGEM